MVLDACLYSNGREKRGVDVEVRGNRENTRGVGGRETIIKIYCMKKYIFNKNKMKEAQSAYLQYNIE